MCSGIKFCVKSAEDQMTSFIEQGRQCTYNATLRPVCITTVAVEEQ